MYIHTPLTLIQVWTLSCSGASASTVKIFFFPSDGLFGTLKNFTGSAKAVSIVRLHSSTISFEFFKISYKRFLFVFLKNSLGNADGNR